jgi:hypothetical protein
MRIQNTILTILIIFIFASCKKELKNQSDLEHIVNESVSSNKQLTQQDWENIDIKFEAFKSDFELNKDKMTQEERDNANHLIGRYNGLRIKQWAKDLKQEISDYSKQMEGVINELQDTTKN